MYCSQRFQHFGMELEFKLVLFLFRTGGFGKDLFSKHKRYQAS
jgi:hypothetical protein